MKNNSDIDDLKVKIDTFKKKEKEKADSFSSFHSSSTGATKGVQLVVDFISGVFIGTAIGYFLDILFKTTPWALIVFTLFGGAAGILNVYRSAQTNNKEL